MKELVPGDSALIIGCKYWHRKCLFLLGRSCRIETNRGTYISEIDKLTIRNAHKVLVSGYPSAAADGLWIIPRRALMPFKDDDNHFEAEKSEGKKVVETVKNQ